MMISTLRTTALAAAAAMALVACGGGGDDGGVVAQNPTPTAPAGGGNQTGATTATWTRTALAANTWHWTATNPSGSLMVATAIPGNVFLSRDQGATWAAPAALPSASWISADVSDDGQTIYALAFNGGMYRSLDGGTTWARVDTAFNAGENLAYESVTVSADGTRVVAVVMGGSVYASSNGRAATPTFAAATLAGGGALTSSWRAVDSDSTGQRVVAASHDGDVYVSTNGGTTFAPLAVTVGGAAVQNGWYRLALSRDGNTVAMAGNEQYGTGVAAAGRSTGLYVGNFAAGAWTFARGSSTVGNYTRVTIANNGLIAATLSGAGATNTGNGQILLSTNNGTSFAPLNTPTGDTVWRSIALTGDGSRAVLAAGTFFATPGGLYRGTRP